MKKTGIIGLGVISKYYKPGLLESDFLKLVSVCDRDEKAHSRQYYAEYPFYTDYIHMIEDEDLDYVIISTPPKTHYEIAKMCIGMGVSVILEKPAVTEKAQYTELVRLANEGGVTFTVMYHFMKAPEMIGFSENFDAKKISRVNIEILDPYSSDEKTINPGQREMCGVWLDSGANAISTLACWFDLEDARVVKTDVIRCAKTSEPIWAYAELLIKGVSVSITVDWRKHRNYKTACLIYDGSEMEVNSTEQKIIYKQKKYDFAFYERLEAHYRGYFKNFKGESDKQTERKINDILLLINGLL